MPEKKYTEIQLSHIANAYAQGDSAKNIALATGVTLYSINEIIDGRGLALRDRTNFDVAYAQGLQDFHGAQVVHRSKMATKRDAAYKVIDQALAGYDENPELAVKVAESVLLNSGIDYAYEKQITAGNTVNTQINFQNSPQGQEVIRGVSQALSYAPKDSKPLSPVGDPSRHVRTSEADKVISKAPKKPKEAPFRDIGIEGEVIDSSSTP